MKATTTARPPRLLALPTWILKHKALGRLLRTRWRLLPVDGLVVGLAVAFGEDRLDYYNLLSDGFLSGHLHLKLMPDPRLLALPNPY